MKPQKEGKGEPTKPRHQLFEATAVHVAKTKNLPASAPEPPMLMLGARQEAVITARVEIKGLNSGIPVPKKGRPLGSHSQDFA